MKTIESEKKKRKNEFRSETKRIINEEVKNIKKQKLDFFILKSINVVYVLS
jgi:hypothetical protein